MNKKGLGALAVVLIIIGALAVLVIIDVSTEKDLNLSPPWFKKIFRGDLKVRDITPTNPTHLECSNQQCVTKPGRGPNLCTTNADCKTCTFIFDKDGDNSVELQADIKDGSVNFNVLYGDGSQYTGVGKDFDERLAVSETNVLTFYEKKGGNDYHSWFVASYRSGSQTESYLLRALVTEDIAPEVNIQKNVEGSWTEVCTDKQAGSTCSIGNVILNIDSITYVSGGDESVTMTGGASVEFHKIYDTVGNYIWLPMETPLPTEEVVIRGSSSQYYFDWYNNEVGIIMGDTSPKFEFEKDGDRSVQLNTQLIDGSVNFNVLYGDGTQYTGTGKDFDERLAVSLTNSLTFYEKFDGNDYHAWFVASYSSGSQKESYLLRALVTEDIGTPEVNIQKNIGGSWTEVCTDKQAGSTCSIGNVVLNIDSITYVPGGDESVTMTGGANVEFDKVYDVAGSFITLPFEDLESAEEVIIRGWPQHSYFDWYNGEVGVINGEPSPAFLFEKDGDNSVALSTIITDGSVNFNVLYGDGSQYTGVGKDFDERLAVSETNVLTFYEKKGGNDYHSWFVASYSSGSQKESYLLRALVTEDIGTPEVNIQKNIGGSWTEVCTDKQAGSTCSIGNVVLNIDSITYVPGGDESVTLAIGVNGEFHKIYDTAGNNIWLPMDDVLPSEEAFIRGWPQQTYFDWYDNEVGIIMGDVC